MAELHVLRVFCAAGGGGNPLGVFLSGAEVPDARRQGIAAELGFSETVFVDDTERGAIRIYTPGEEVPFAGHPVVGTAWLLARTHGEVAALHAPAGRVPVHEVKGLTYAAGRPDWAPDWEFVELGSPDEVDGLDGPPGGLDAVSAWAWIDEAEGIVRARVFAPRYGIAEDEATGSAAVGLAGRLRRELDIRQGAGSEIVARPLPDGMVEIGGRVELDDVREYAI
ncbi:MAG TPA: PhzF family phenazine biosynthesis protein [Solirubrobacterales bacterium]|jgi:predicted PhzF superfamily epimerase YddE/YHI9